jgi:hypothetical protein
MSSNKTSRKSSMNGFNKLKREIKDLNRWKKKTIKLLSELDSRMGDLNNRVMDELDYKVKLTKDVEKNKSDLIQGNGRIDDLVIDISRQKYIIDVVKYILKEDFSANFRPYHIDTHRPNVSGDSLPRSSGSV